MQGQLVYSWIHSQIWRAYVPPPGHCKNASTSAIREWGCSSCFSLFHQHCIFLPARSGESRKRLSHLWEFECTKSMVINFWIFTHKYLRGYFFIFQEDVVLWLESKSVNPQVQRLAGIACSLGKLSSESTDRIFSFQNDAEIYVTCLYFVCTVFTTVGFGEKSGMLFDI